MKLTVDEISFFRENGYLIKRNVLDIALMAEARERLWHFLPEGRSPQKPNSLIGPFSEAEEDRSHPNEIYNFRVNYRSIGHEPWMVRLLAKDPNVWNMAEQMLGKGSLQEPDRIRGIYCTLPFGNHPKPPLTCHVDGHPFHLGVVGYIDDVAPTGGSFSVWPGSHKHFYYAFNSQYEHDRNEEYPLICEYYNGHQPVDCFGEAGDIVFWHHRLAHMASPNSTCNVRQAVLYDFKKTDINQTQLGPPLDNMWEDWSAEFRNN